MPSCSNAKLTRCGGGPLLLLALLWPILLPSAPAVAQEQSAASPRRHSLRRTATLDERVARLAKALDLNETQRSAVKKILEQRQQQVLNIRRDSTISGSARIAQFRALQEDTVQRIRAVLNDEQKKKYDPLAPRRVPPAQNQRSVEDWIKLTTPK